MWISQLLNNKEVHLLRVLWHTTKSQFSLDCDVYSLPLLNMKTIPIGIKFSFHQIELTK